MTLIETGNHEVNADGDPDLRLYCVFGVTVKSLDPEVLLNPFEKQFNLPATFVDLCHSDGRKFQMVGDENKILSGFRICETDTSELSG